MEMYFREIDMKTILLAAAVATLAFAGCMPIANTSQSIITRSLFDVSAIGGPEYPLVVSGAENVGMTPAALAQGLRFPPRVRSDSSFRAVQHSPALINHAHLDISPSGNNATAILTFKHGERRIGVGTFTLARQDFANPNALGRISATMINSMLREAEQQKSDEDRPCVFPCT